jgi:hypothetical protein
LSWGGNRKRKEGEQRGKKMLPCRMLGTMMVE